MKYRKTRNRIRPLKEHGKLSNLITLNFVSTYTFEKIFHMGLCTLRKWYVKRETEAKLLSIFTKFNTSSYTLDKVS